MYNFRTFDSARAIADLRKQCYQSLTAPLDGMWDNLAHQAVIKGVFYKDNCIGYLCHDHAFTLLNFYILDKWLNQKRVIFGKMLQEEAFPQAYVSTNQPCFLTACMEFAKRTSVYYYLFEDTNPKAKPASLSSEFAEADLVKAEWGDITKIVNFCRQTTAADEVWLTQYIREWVDKDGIYYLLQNKKILGTCEIRKSDTQSGYADLGTIVSSRYRNKGLGTFLMKRGKIICYEAGLQPICSCRYDNVGSKKMIERAGFINKNVMLKVGFIF